MSSHTPPRSLRTELFLRLGPPFSAAVVLPIVLITLWPRLSGIALGLAVAADIVLISAYTRLVLRTVIVEPLHALSRAADDIGANDLTRRMPPSRLRELQALGATVDRLTSRVLADQAQLVRAEKLASIGRLSASVAHEIGNPLGAMLGHVHLLRKQLLRRAAPTEDLELLAAMERESARIERIVRGLLDYARARPPLPSAVDVHDVVRSTIDLLRSQGALDRIDVVLELADAPLMIDGQRHDLEQLFVNIVLNAADAMNGRGRIVVRLERVARFTLREPATRRAAPEREALIAHPPSSRVQRWLEGNDSAEVARIVVADSGPGVPAALAERIFDPFFTTKPKGKGTGLGLAIVARIVENFRGAIWVTTAREGGAAFHLLFPMASISKPHGRSALERRRRPTPPVARVRVAKG